MLRSIPARILTHNITVSYAPTLDAWGAADAEATTYDVKHVNVQPMNETRKSKDNTEVDLVGICFADARLSTPALDYWELKNAAEAAGGDLTITFGTRVFAVKTVDALYDDQGILHHWELGLI